MNINLFYSICILILISIFCIFFLKLYKKTNSLKIYLILLTLISLNLYYSSHSPITSYPDTLPIKETIHMTDKEIVYNVKSLIIKISLYIVYLMNQLYILQYFLFSQVMTIFGCLVMGLNKKIIGLLINQITCNLLKKKIIIVLFLQGQDYKNGTNYVSAIFLFIILIFI